jgi:hypothetical protein
MDTLRWVILLIGIVIVLGIYVFSTWQARRRQEPDASQSRRRSERIPVDVLFDDYPGNAAVDAELESLGKLIAEDADAGVPRPSSSLTRW